MSALLELHGISKRFGAVQALGGVDFTLRAGEVVGLVGDNGAGKSTLIKVISGIYLADSGEYRFEGAPRRIGGPSDAAALGVATVYQDLALCDNLDVVSNLFIGREEVARGPARLLRALDEPSMERQASELLRTLTVSLPSVRQEVGTLSGGQRQSVAIARSLIGEAKVVLLDEPTAALGVAQTAQVLALIKRLREQGLGVVVISHNLADVFEVVDRIVVLRLGRNAGVFDARAATREQVVAAITGAERHGAGAAPGGEGTGAGPRHGAAPGAEQRPADEAAR